MKTFLAVLAGASFLLVNAGELLINGDFDSGTMNNWYNYLASADDEIQIKTFDWGTDLYFVLGDGGGHTYEVQLFQPIVLRAGYRYSLAIGGSGIDADKTVDFGIGHNGNTGGGGDGNGDFTRYAGSPVTLTKDTYTEFKKTWDNPTINDSYARVFIDGGGNAVDYSIAWVSVWESPIDTTPPAATARFTRFGFYTDGSKRVVVKGAAGASFELRSGAGSAVFSGTLGAPSPWQPSGETVSIADFSTVKTNGACTLYCDNKNIGTSMISPNPLQALGKAALKAFYYQRASAALASAYAGTWARAAGHPDTAVALHPSAGSGRISSSKGWYDAGDYGKYIINSGISVYTLLALHEHFPGFSSSIELTIPESGDNVPDILDEVRWNLEWMLTMQAADGGVYSKVTPLQFDSVIMPGNSKTARYAFMKTTPASLDFAANMAMSSRLYKSFDAAFAGRCLEAAKKAYAWTGANPSVKYIQPADCNTGEYQDDVFSDEYFWASIELSLATGSTEYSYHTTHPMPSGGVASWQNVGTLGLYTLLTNMQAFPAALVDTAKARIMANADTLLGRQKTGYGISMNNADFYWGSNHVAVSQGILMLYAYYLTKNTDYLAGAEQQIDYVLGRNPFGKCYVTGFGDFSPQHPHHRISESDGIAAPVPGFLVGGPHMGGEDTSYCGNYLDKPATSWADRFCSSPTNEVAINWNAVLAYCVNALEALHNGATVSGFKKLPTAAWRPLFSNPADDRITCSMRKNSLVFRCPRHPGKGGMFFIYNAQGKQLAQSRMVEEPSGRGGSFSVSIPRQSLPAGYAIVRIAGQGKQALLDQVLIP